MSLDIDKLSPIIRKAALENAIKFKGTANPKALIGVVMREFPDAKNDMQTVSAEISEIVTQVNALGLEKQEQELLKINPEFYSQEQAKKQERKEARSELPELQGAIMGKVVTRMPPEPSKYNHVGHALNFLINYLYAQKYEGKCLLRFDDTNPETSKQEYVDAMQEDVLEYLDIKPKHTIFASDDMQKFLDLATQLVEKNSAYTCSCQGSTMSEGRRNMQACACREKDIAKVQEEWKNMCAGTVQEGALVLRLKIDMSHKNAVMRDPVIIRIVKAPHYRTSEQFCVWPMYDFESALEDALTGVTHTLRSNEFESRIELHDYIKDLFLLPKSIVKQYGRFNITGATTQGREIRALIEEGKVIGWDDPRLVTLRALKRRGIVKEALYELAKQCGMSKTQTNIDFSVIAASNRRILDETANRYFFVEEPVKISVQDWPSELKTVELKLHPHNERGGRPLKLDGEFFIAQKDFAQIEDGKVFRLIDTVNLQYDKETQTCSVHSTSVEEFRKEKNKFGLIHFLPANEKLIKASIFTPQAEYIDGLCEPTIAQLKTGATIQFERYCFARLDSIEDGTYNFWYTHE